MSLLLFHQGNVPIIEDDMKFAEIKLENYKTTGKTGHSSGLLLRRMYSVKL